MIEQDKRMTKLPFAVYFFMEVVQLGLEATRAVKLTEVPQTLGNIDDGDLEKGVGGMGGALLNRPRLRDLMHHQEPIKNY